MTTYYKTEGFVFKKEDRFEADRVFSVFTKDFGRVEIVGKSIRKINSKLRRGIEIFSLSEIEFVQSRNRKTLIDAVLRKKFKNASQLPEKLAVAYEICAVLDSFIKGPERDEQILILLQETFERLNSHESQLVYFYFFWNLIFILGYGSELSVCAHCRTQLDPLNLYFSHSEGGMLCHTCALLKKGGLKIDSGSVKILRLIIKKDWEILSRLKIENGTQRLLKEISDSHYNYLLYLA